MKIFGKGYMQQDGLPRTEVHKSSASRLHPLRFRNVTLLPYRPGDEDAGVVTGRKFESCQIFAGAMIFQTLA